MSANSQNVTYSGSGEQDHENTEGAVTEVMSAKCVKVPLDEHIFALINKNNLVRQEEPLKCSSNLIDKVILNYIIVKEILSNLSWQDKLLCELVCTTWNSAVQTLRREQLGPGDFVTDFRTHSLTCGTVYKQSGKFHNNPLVVMAFVNTSGFNMSCQCKLIKPSPCLRPCKKEHCLIDVVHKISCAPKDCMNIIRSDYTTYMPLPQSVTFEHTLTNLKSHPFIGGLYIPVIPDVKFHTINLKSNGNMQDDFYNTVDEIAKERTFKGVLVYVTDKYLLRSVEDIVFLNYLKDVQPNVPYALGGCIIEDTIFEQRDIDGIVDAVNKGNDFISENLISIGLFTIPKESPCNEYNFDMYSFILESSDWTKAKIQQAINEFSKKVPKFEYSVVIKLSCVGRDQKHKWEQECFRAVFPNTRIIGCFGNGEIGVNHPTRPPPVVPTNCVKRHRRDSGPQFGIVYSYSTVFVYIGWGKITLP
ncbi:uncharacterized protein LOC113403041 [Vanessa tameamea]|uniref:Uncharacterized protein LOC113403041 n=1 Tax=Vanessa tameamea TaxID=334116 RepID=A0A8B8IQ41_VANTA|nr:uncharacterized protein LOC113403041 [Vanessa tameamea]